MKVTLKKFLLEVACELWLETIGACLSRHARIWLHVQGFDEYDISRERRKDEDWLNRSNDVKFMPHANIYVSHLPLRGASTGDMLLSYISASFALPKFLLSHISKATLHICHA